MPVLGVYFLFLYQLIQRFPEFHDTNAHFDKIITLETTAKPMKEGLFAHLGLT
jgi:hypothetical protein